MVAGQAPSQGWNQPFTLEDYYRQQRVGLMETKLTLIDMINHLRELIFRQQLQLTQFQQQTEQARQGEQNM